MIEMKKRELEKWEETRAEGKWKFIINNALFALLFAFLVFFLGNAYENRDQIELYVNSFFFKIWHNLLTLAIAFVGLLITSTVIWKINESRYRKAKAAGVGSEVEGNDSDKKSDK